MYERLNRSPDGSEIVHNRNFLTFFKRLEGTQGNPGSARKIGLRPPEPAPSGTALLRRASSAVSSSRLISATAAGSVAVRHRAKTSSTARCIATLACRCPPGCRAASSPRPLWRKTRCVARPATGRLALASPIGENDPYTIRHWALCAGRLSGSAALAVRGEFAS